MGKLIFSVVIPVYRNLESLPDLIRAMTMLAKRFRDEHAGELEVVFVVDGSPDRSLEWLETTLPEIEFRSKLIAHSRNFGAFAAIRTGLAAASAENFGVMAADLQEPPELMLEFYRNLTAPDCDVVVGRRVKRDDPRFSAAASNLFWGSYRLFVQRDVPPGGVDIFGCDRNFRDELVKLGEANSSLVGLLFWLGFQRREVPYERRAREHGKSAWSLRKKINYLMDSMFSFTDLPIKILMASGTIGLIIAVPWSLIVILTYAFLGIEVPGYTATILAVLFFGALNLLALGVVGAYTWRAYENTKQRPLSVIMQCKTFSGASAAAEPRLEKS